MAHLKNTITINGKIYDATTGDIVGGANTHPSTTRQPSNTETTRTKPKSARSLVSAKAIHHVNTRSKTLMRNLVKNPVVGKPHKSAAHGALDRQQHMSDFLEGGAGQAKPSSLRLQRAQKAPRSTLVSHFNAHTGLRVTKKQTVLAVKQAPRKRHTSSPASVIKTDKDFLIDAALLRSTSHEQPAHKLSKRKHRVARKLGLSPLFVSVTAAVVAVVILGAFFTFQNLPQLAMRIASSKAGVHASLPSYRPNGFALNGSINYAPGQVSFDFRAPDNREYRITQTKSAWNSETLQKTYFDNNKQEFQVRQDRGRSIFVYNGSNVTWVDNGILYKIEASSGFGTDQLLRLAASL